jgi:type IV secretory pathway VirB3-like protein
MSQSRVRSALTIPALILGIPWNLVIFALIGVASVLHGVVYVMASIQNAIAIWR